MNTKKIILLVVACIVVAGLVYFTASKMATQNSSSATGQASGVTEGAFAPSFPTKTFTMADVATHHDESSCYTVINGNVYDLTSYIPKHPGGKYTIMKICGIDGTEMFTNKHGGQQRPQDMLKTLIVGTLVK